jgi:adenylate cyclase
LERRLAAILAADVVGYTALMGADEAGTYRRLTALRQDVLEPLIARYRGRTVKLMGDGFLVEFASVVDAVSCAQVWQEAVARHAAKDDLGSLFQFRIGINLGDVIVEGDDIHGDGVNIAARLEGLAKPGGICLSDDAYRQARGKTQASFEDMGVQNLKNVSEPMRVYRIVGDSTEKTVLASAREPLALPAKPSIAVLAFTNMSGDPDQEYFSDGITEDVITGLSKFRSLFVIARNSSFKLKGEPIDVQDVAELLGVRYILEGSVRKSGKRVRVTAQLIDGLTGSHVWAEKFDRNLEDVFVVQDEITEAIVGTLSGRLDAAESSLISSKATVNLSAYECLLQGLAHFHLHTIEDEAEARILFRRATKLDDRYERAYAMLAMTYFTERFWTWPKTGELSEGIAFAEKAYSIDPSDPWSLAALGLLLFLAGEAKESEAKLRASIQLNPHDAQIIHWFGFILVYIGKAEEGLLWIERSSRLDPFYDVGTAQGIASFHVERFEDAIEALSRATNAGRWEFAYLAAAFGQLGEKADAERFARRFVRLRREELLSRGDPLPQDEISLAEEEIAWFRKTEDGQRLRDGLTKAGLTSS